VVDENTPASKSKKAKKNLRMVFSSSDDSDSENDSDYVDDTCPSTTSDNGNEEVDSDEFEMDFQPLPSINEDDLPLMDNGHGLQRVNPDDKCMDEHNYMELQPDLMDLQVVSTATTADSNPLRSNILKSTENIVSYSPVNENSITLDKFVVVKYFYEVNQRQLSRHYIG